MNACHEQTETQLVTVEFELKPMEKLNFKSRKGQEQQQRSK